MTTQLLVIFLTILEVCSKIFILLY